MKTYAVLFLLTAGLIMVGLRTGAFTHTRDGIADDHCQANASLSGCCDPAMAAASCCQTSGDPAAADCPCAGGGGECCGKCQTTSVAATESCCGSGAGSGCQTPSSRAMALASAPNPALRPTASGSNAEDGDWPMWGGTQSRNMISTAKKINIDFDLREGKHVAWTSALGSQTYGNAIVAGGKVVVGTNNGGGYRADKYPAEEDKGVILCFDEATGEFQWQLTRDKLSIGRVCDWPLQGICSTPTIERDASEEQGWRMWVVTNRGELMCLDMEGMKNGNDGVVQDEVDATDKDADILWSLDMINDLGVFPHNLATSSPLVYGDRVYLLTSNGVDEAHLEMPAPRAPSMICVDKNSGELVWEQNYPEDRVLHGQWSSPSMGIVNGKPQIYFPAGDGWLYALNPDDGEIIWKFDLNPKEAVWELGGAGSRNAVIATPVFHDNSVIIAVGQDPEHGEGVGHLWRIDATKTGDVSSELGEIGKPGKPNPNSALIWQYGGVDSDGSKTGEAGRSVFRRTISTVAVSDDLVFAADLSGFLHCVDLKSGKRHWEYDLFSAVWGSPMVVDGKVFLGLEDGKVIAFERTAEEARVLKEYDTVNYSSVYTTPTIANRRMFISDRTRLYAVELDDK
jgi:outer membrane protein assembly factor BamB